MVRKRRDIISLIHSTRKGKFAIWVIFLSFLIGLLSPFIANERPHIAKVGDSVYFPIIHELGEDLGICKPYPFVAGKDWKEVDFEFQILAPIPFSPTKISPSTPPYQSPMSINEQVNRRHWLGTDGIGRDVAAIIIHGYRYAIWVGMFSLIIACLLGVTAGACMGYFGDDTLGVGFLPLAFSFLCIGLVLFYAVHLGLYTSALGILSVILLLFLIGLFLFSTSRKLPNQAKLNLPLDIVLMRVLEIFRSVPNIFILLALMSLITKPNIWNVIFIIGLLKWPSIARLMRAEILNIRNKEYILAAKTYGQRDIKILMNHALPNAIGPVIIAFAFGVSSAILLEATISFLGIGVNPDQITWGNLLSNARGNFNAWWLAIFPGLALFTLLLALNYLGECLSDILNPKRSVSLT